MYVRIIHTFVFDVNNILIITIIFEGALPKVTKSQGIFYDFW